MTKSTPTIALLYDFDKTLCTTDMQEYTFIPSLGIGVREFWDEADRLARTQHMDRILAYMYLMLRKASAADHPVRRRDFVALGADIEFFPGVRDWFSRMNGFGAKLGVRIEHYIISSGLREIIEGSPIKDEFCRIFACEFHYDANGAADWPLVAVNYTGKTQFLFRINKGVTDISDDASLNRYIPEDERPIPFRNMIYFGDGMTDVPCMKLVRSGGGSSVAVYTDRASVEGLLADDRVNFIAPADYSEGGELDSLVRAVITNAVYTDRLIRLTANQRRENDK